MNPNLKNKLHILKDEKKNNNKIFVRFFQKI